MPPRAGAALGARSSSGSSPRRRSHGIWTIQTTIMAENAASLALHAAAGFRTVGRRDRLARRDGRWHDAVLLELRLP